MPREYDFGDGGKVVLTARTHEHADMFAALQTLGPAGAKIAKYINDLKMEVKKREVRIAALRGETKEDDAAQAEVHRQEFPTAAPGRQKPRRERALVFSDSHTPGPWHMNHKGMIKAGPDWICAVTARNRRFNAPVIQAAPDMLAMLERMLGNASPQEARCIIAEAAALVERAKAPAWGTAGGNDLVIASRLSQ